MKRLVIFILFLALLAFFGNEGWLKFYKLKSVENGLREENRLLAEHNMTLLTEIDDLKDPKYLEHYIREELGYVKAGEVLYELP